MKVLVIGGTGHIGSYLAPRLVMSGHDVTVVARHSEPQYTDARLGWPKVTWINADRVEEEKTDAWAKRMAAIDTEVVMDLIAYSPEQNQTMMKAFQGRVQHFIHCGTVWAYGPSSRQPYEEWFPRRPDSDYGIKKAAIEKDLLTLYRLEGFPATIIHPGHISGRKWLPIDPQGSRDGVGVYERLAQGQEVCLPDMGNATIHHVHGDDVSQLFELAMDHREQAYGRSFSAVTAYALSLTECCRCVAGFFGKEPNLRYVSLAQMKNEVSETSYGIICEHVSQSPCASIAQGKRLLGYEPRYTTEQIFYESIDYMLESGQLKL